ncbi:MAG: low molecular weight phosphatase family protein, partial [Nanoarchaeota archaeon]|nr:low molecular weight phosphatase family protein [Nanoarchaeota archaeon]
MKILFVCAGNVGRSQMAEAFFNRKTKKHHATSAGARCGDNDGKKLGNIGFKVIDCMKEEYINLKGKPIKQVKPEMVEDADKVIIIMEHRIEDIPDFLKNSEKVDYWPIPDPKDTSYEFYS